MKKYKYMVILLITLLVIVISALITLLNMKKKVNVENVWTKIDSEKEFLKIQKCVNEYTLYLNFKDYEVIGNLLSSEYMKVNKITLKNIDKKLDDYGGLNIFRAKEMYKKDNGNISTYCIKGTITPEAIVANHDIPDDIEQGEIEEVINENQQEEYREIIAYFIINTDNKNLTYDIIPINENQYLKRNIQYSSIQKNRDNSYNPEYMKTSSLVVQYFEEYVEKVKFDLPKAYDLLEKEYKEDKYPTYKVFEEYYENQDIDLIYESTISIYSIQEKDGYTDYICFDEENNGYKIREYDLMDYKIILDIYK